MFISRGGSLLRRVLSSTNRFAVNNAAIGSSRNSGSHSWAYRGGVPHHSKANLVLAEVVGGFMWWWVLWHLWHDYEHITGEFPYPDPTKWTDAELGIPPDDEE